MESVHGVDISWMSKHSSNNFNSKAHTAHHGSPTTSEESKKAQNGHHADEPASPKATPGRPNFARSNSTEKTITLNGSLPKSGTPSPTTGRRNSWLSSISSKFSSSPGAHPNQAQNSSPPASTTPTIPEVPVPTGPSAPKNAILPHAVKASGDVPYTPAPVKTGQPSFLQSALRRLSSSGGQLSGPHKAIQHGLCERRVLNVDPNRERCHISDLDQSKLRRVAFCVDVEIASGPRYHHDSVNDEKKKEQKERKRLTERGEAEALKNPLAVTEEKEVDGVLKTTGENVPKGSAPELPKEASETTKEVDDENVAVDKETTKKKEKKKRSEEERKARKEKKRKLAEANGTVPVELVRDGSDSSLSTTTGTATPKTQASPTTDPVRIYRRCCQLRETPILKKITEQLGAAPTNLGPPGVVAKLDLTGYWLQLPDLVTLGDYLAVVPVKELVMENCGLTDEGVRVILAGLLAAKNPDWERKKVKKTKWGEVPQGGFVERVVFKNNSKIGKDGWHYICTFIAMCRSLKSMDLSKVPFPQPPAGTPVHGPGHLTHTTSRSSTTHPELSYLLSQAIGERLAGREFELLNVAECGMTTEQLSYLIDGVIKSGLRRLGIAGNNITPEGMQHVARYIRDGKCEGLDLGGNDLKNQLGVIADALTENNALYALSLADCNLTPESLWALFPALAKLKNFRFIDLSQNHGLFDSEPTALSLLRRYLPKLPTLKRIHLTDVSMTPEQAIALAEILPESPNLAHVNIMENPKLAMLSDARDEANQEEACALYASLMAAVRVSKTIICIDIEVPSPESSEVVKALAKQVVAYCLWNMERGPVAEISQAAAAISEPHGGEKEVAVPDVLLHLVGHVEGFHENHDEDEPAPDEDYVIGGTGVVKALGICLRNRVNDTRRPSADRAFSDSPEGGSGSATPRSPLPSGGKAKDMSKNLLGSARKIRARLQPALVKESRTGDRNSYQRLLFLDQTLEGMIKRFEDEFPETRLPSSVTSPPLPDMGLASPAESLELNGGAESHISDTEPALAEAIASDDEEGLRPVLSRHNSDVSLASRALSQEEGRMHRFGQQFRRDMVNPDIEHGPTSTPGSQDQPMHMKLLRAMVEGTSGEEIKNRILNEGEESIIRELSNEASELRQVLKEQDPEGWVKFVESQEAAMRNQRLAGMERNVSAIE
ncbi:cell wall biogenesis protein-like protein Mhp1 [Hyaloscypha hepaticicola]|uniref:Cell wall biogenesis protein-like protein Mhp1 n=1 Tax=Hyaloscypha hepaticicola TaxID=2082293 RepID=A0A2J6PNS6_9HELO|nr:cell wall biogenesis protein-like protein Mhp1 [Hyaloscypha hepaticicola]